MTGEIIDDGQRQSIFPIQPQDADLGINRPDPNNLFIGRKRIGMTDIRLLTAFQCEPAVLHDTVLVADAGTDVDRDHAMPGFLHGLDSPLLHSAHTFPWQWLAVMRTFAGRMPSSACSRERTLARYALPIQPISAMATALTVTTTAVVASSRRTNALTYSGSFTRPGVSSSDVYFGDPCPELASLTNTAGPDGVAALLVVQVRVGCEVTLSRRPCCRCHALLTSVSIPQGLIWWRIGAPAAGVWQAPARAATPIAKSAAWCIGVAITRCGSPESPYSRLDWLGSRRRGPSACR